MTRTATYKGLNRAEREFRLLYDVQGHALVAHVQPELESVNDRLRTRLQAKNGTMTREAQGIEADDRFSSDEKLIQMYDFHREAYRIGDDVLGLANQKLLDAIHQAAEERPRP
jgi:hypothetical protein